MTAPCRANRSEQGRYAGQGDSLLFFTARFEEVQSLRRSINEQALCAILGDDIELFAKGLCIARHVHPAQNNLLLLHHASGDSVGEILAERILDGVEALVRVIARAYGNAGDSANGRADFELIRRLRVHAVYACPTASL